MGYSTEEAQTELGNFFNTVNTALLPGSQKLQEILANAVNPGQVFRNIGRWKSEIESGNAGRALQEAAQTVQQMFQNRLSAGLGRGEATRQALAYARDLGLSVKALDITRITQGTPEEWATWQRRIDASRDFNREWQHLLQTGQDFLADVAEPLLPVFQNLNAEARHFVESLSRADSPIIATLKSTIEEVTHLLELARGGGVVADQMRRNRELNDQSTQDRALRNIRRRNDPTYTEEDYQRDERNAIENRNEPYGPFRPKGGSAGSTLPGAPAAGGPGGRQFIGGPRRLQFTGSGIGGGAAGAFHPDPDFLSGSPMSTNIEDRRGEAEDQMKALTNELKRLNDNLFGAGAPAGAFGFTGGGSGGLGAMRTMMGGLGAGGGMGDLPGLGGGGGGGFRFPGGGSGPGIGSAGGGGGSGGGGGGDFGGGGGGGVAGGVRGLPGGPAGGAPIYRKMLAAFQGSGLVGKVPPDGARFGITTGSAEEWARFGTAVAKAESNFNPRSANTSDPGGSFGVLQYAHGQVPGGNAYDTDASIAAFVRDSQQAMASGGIRSPNSLLRRRFSTIGSHPERTSRNLASYDGSGGPNVEIGPLSVGGGGQPVSKMTEAMAPAGTRAGSAAPGGLTTIRTDSGKSFTVASAYADNFKGFLNDYEKSGGVIGPDSGGVGNRGNASYHPRGMAIDLNQTGYGVRSRLGTTLPQGTEDELAAKWGLFPGSQFKRRSDIGHFEVRNREAAQAAIERMRQGGDGKSTGVANALDWSSGRQLDKAQSVNVNGTGKLSVDVRAPAGTGVSATGKGLFKEVEMNRQTTMSKASSGPREPISAEE
jgi:hypothetical protein